MRQPVPVVLFHLPAKRFAPGQIPRTVPASCGRKPVPLYLEIPATVGNIPLLLNLTWPILALALVTFLSRLTLFLGVKHLGGLQTALLGLAELFVTIVLAQWWLGERLSFAQWLGAALLFLTFILIGLDRQPPEKRKTDGWLAWINPTGMR